jgi:hypothetical protein
MREPYETLRKRADLIRHDLKLRHTPNEHDMRIASENARFMDTYQYQTIKSESRDTFYNGEYVRLADLPD